MHNDINMNLVLSNVVTFNMLRNNDDDDDRVWIHYAQYRYWSARLSTFGSSPVRQYFIRKAITHLSGVGALDEKLV